ncbi:unnamed protein product [Haemonchus placei]|uniref:Reticulocyte-binding protein 2 a n=1 Tax=Haemonchus placei TaxID=6290 RepID=A0A0N4WU70_HAEPC|nr:unnamed protein product [Haemonchus placei]
MEGNWVASVNIYLFWRSAYGLSCQVLSFCVCNCGTATLNVKADVVFTRERCDRSQFGLQPLRGEPSRYRQCGPNGRVWIVPCMPGALFNPLIKARRRTQEAIPITEEFIFSTRRPKRPRPKTKGRTLTSAVSTTVPPTPATSPSISSENPSVSYTMTTAVPPSSLTPREANPWSYSPAFTPPTRNIATFATAPLVHPTLWPIREVALSQQTLSQQSQYAYPDMVGPIPISESHLTGSYPTSHGTTGQERTHPELVSKGVPVIEQTGNYPTNEQDFLRGLLRLVKSHQVAIDGIREEPSRIPVEMLRGSSPERNSNFIDYQTNAHHSNELQNRIEIDRERLDKQRQKELLQQIEKRREKERNEQQEIARQAEENLRKERQEWERQQEKIRQIEEKHKKERELKRQQQMARQIEERRKKEYEEKQRQIQEAEQKEKNERKERQRQLELARLAEEAQRKEREERKKQQEIAREMEERERKEKEEYERQRQVAREIEERRKIELKEVERQRQLVQQFEERKKNERKEKQRQMELARLLEEDRKKEMEEKKRQQEAARQIEERKRKEKEEQERQQQLARQIEERQKKAKEEQDRLQKVYIQIEEKKKKEKEEREELQKLAQQIEERQKQEREEQERQQRLEKKQKKEKEEQERRRQKELEEQETLRNQEQKRLEAERIRHEEEWRRMEKLTRVEDRNGVAESVHEAGNIGYHSNIVSSNAVVPERMNSFDMLTSAVESNRIAFFTSKPPTTSSPVLEWVASPNSWRPSPDPTLNQPKWIQTTTTEPPSKVIPGCDLSEDCHFSYEQDLLCAHPNDPSRYLQCTPMIGRRGRWMERNCPPSLVFIQSYAACGTDVMDVSTPPYGWRYTAVIPRLPTETEIVRWQGNRELPKSMGVPPSTFFATPPPNSIYETIQSFPEGLHPFSRNTDPAADYESDNIDTMVDPPFPRVQPYFLSPFSKQRDGSAETDFMGGFVKPMIKKIAMDQAETFLDQILSDQVIKDDNVVTLQKPQSLSEDG